MNKENILDEIEKRIRIREFKEEDERIRKEKEEERKNRDFTQVYKQGWDKINFLIDSNPNALKVYIFLAENIDYSCGAVIVTQEFLSRKLNCSDRTIRNHIKYLEENFCLVKIPLAIGGVNAYALNPEEIWKGYNSSKDYAAFNTKTLTDKDGEVIKKLKVMLLKEQEKKESSDKKY